jgi:hypothetical protein
VVVLLVGSAGWMVGWWNYLRLGVGDVVLALGMPHYVYCLAFGHVCFRFPFPGSWEAEGFCSCSTNYTS